jgi:hypothetical protein
MATKEEIVAHVVRPLTANYGVVKDDPEAFRDLLIRTLSSYTPTALDRAVEKLVMTRKYKTWPTIAEIVGAAKGNTGEKEKGKYPLPMRGVTAENFWQQSSLFVERDMEARGTCLEYVRKGTAQWEAWAIYLDLINLQNHLLRGLGWYAPTMWPWQFDMETGPKAQPPIDFIEYEPEGTMDYSEEHKPTAEEKKRVVDMWQNMRIEMLKSAKRHAII